MNESINFTIKSIFDSTWELTNDCINWCQEQAFIHQNNLTVEAMLIPIVALISLVVNYIIINHHVAIISRSDITEAQLEKVCRYASDFAMYLLIGFFIWFIYFR